MKIRLYKNTVILTMLMIFGMWSPVYSQELHTVYFFGNLADLPANGDFSKALKVQLEKEVSPFTLIVNGDLVSQKVGKENTVEDLKKVYELADMIEQTPNGQLILLPGDRDWNDSKKGGESSIKNLEKRIKKYLKDNDYEKTDWAIKRACPGPEIYEINEGLMLITLNSQWWNHPYDKPRPSDASCDAITAEALKEELEDAVEENHDKNILIVGHHPIYSLGNYGGRFSVGDQFKPFPVLGSFETAFHANVGDHKDLANEHLSEFTEGMNNLLYFHSNLIYASSHEKNQQIIRRGDNFLLNSGAAGETSFVTKDNNTILSKKAIGIMKINYEASGDVNTSLLTLADGLFKEEEKHRLFSSICLDTSTDSENIIKNTSYVPCNTEAKATYIMTGRYDDLKTLPAGEEYSVNAFRRMVFGKHYRTTWTTPVSVPYLDLDKTFGGLNIYKKGGGRQTTSLKFKSGNGTEYTFRSVNKDPSKALNYKLRPSFITSVFRDQTSAQQPYGALVVAPLLDKIDILHAKPKLYVLPDDTKLGAFQYKYGNLFGMLEENPGKPNNKGDIFGGSDKVVRSSKLFKDLYKHQNSKVNPSEFVRARLFDLLVGDWSKHEDNWKWAAYNGADGSKEYRPIPRDRDHVFSRQDGILPWLADRRFGLLNIENFAKEYKDILSLSWQARHMDRFLGTEADKELFLKEVKYIQDNISDADIEAAVRSMPPEAYEKSGKEIEEKLKNRLKTLPEAAMTYYKLLADEVEVVGSNENEYVEINMQSDGKINIKMYNEVSKSKGEKLLYNRTLLPEETKELRVYGLGGDDVFNVVGDGKSKIKLRILGGPGDDTFQDNAANARTFLYDKGEETAYEITGNSKQVNHWNKNIYEYDRKRFEYNSSIPIVALGYNNFSGFGAKIGTNLSIKKFGKDDFHSKHTIVGGYTTQGNISAKYRGQFHQVFKTWDIQVKAFYDDVNTNFFGIGNSTIKDDDLFDADFYDAFVNTRHFSVGLIKEFWERSSFDFSIGIEQNESEEVAGTFLSENANAYFGTHEKLTILPVNFNLDIDFLDSKITPYKGTSLLLKYHNGTITSLDNENYGVAEGVASFYVSTRTKNPLTCGFRIGGAYSHGDQIPWYKLPVLGTGSGLNGFFEDRFRGESSVYYNFELRYQLFEKETSFLPLRMGVRAFYDRGRVFIDNTETNESWQSGYGFGLYLVPLTDAFTVSLAVSFSDEESVYPVIGIATPLR